MSTEETLREWVVQHKVCWEIAPLVERNGGNRNLKEVALFALPHEERPSRYDIAPFHASFCLRPESEWVPEVQLTIQIIHREGYFRPIDDCEKKCAGEIQKCLRRLGAQAKSWSAFRRAS